MKKLILLALTALMMVGCEKTSNKTRQEKIDEKYAEKTFIVDSCEYISFCNSFTHKGNCRFCKERRQKELEKLVEQLNEK